MEHVDAYVIFAKVGELQSISGAARALGLPKANVSRAIGKLESAYKVALMDRTSSPMRMTDVGRTLHVHCLRVLEEMEEAGARIAAHRGSPSGTLRIGCSADVGRSLLGPGIPIFLDRHPEIDVRLKVGERLKPEPGSLDVVLHAGWLADSRLIVRKIADIRTLLVASRRYIDEYGSPDGVEDLARHRVLGNFYLDRADPEQGRLPARVPLLELAKGRKRFPVPIWKRFASTDHSIMLDLVRRGIAIAPVPVAQASPELDAGELVHILPMFEIYDQASLYALYTERIAMAPKVKVFLDFVEELVRSGGALTI